MPTQIMHLTATPTNVITAVTPPLAVGATYSARYRANGPELLQLVSAASAPAGDAIGLPVRNLEDVTIVPETGEGVYAWTRDGSGYLVINEVP